MKVLSFNMNGQIYLLGDYELKVSKFDSMEECEHLFSSVKNFDESSPLARKTKEIFSAILGGDPKLHEVIEVDDLTKDKILTENTQTVIIADAADPSDIAVCLFQCAGENAAKWHEAGEKFGARQKTVEKVEAHEKFEGMVKQAVPEVIYTHPGIMNIPPGRFVLPTETLH